MFKELLNLISPGAKVPTGERRETIRLDCYITATLKVKDSTREVRVINASLTGLGLEMESKLRKKTKVMIHRDKFGGPVSGVVTWCRSLKGSNRYQVGVEYVDDKNMLRSSWIKPALKELGFSVGRINEKRQLTRVPGNRHRCFLKNNSGDTYSAGELLNLSVGGASVESEVDIPKGHQLILKVDPLAKAPELVIEAEVKSSKRNPKTRKYNVGLRFLESDDKLLKTIRRHMAAMMDIC